MRSSESSNSQRHKVKHPPSVEIEQMCNEVEEKRTKVVGGEEGTSEPRNEQNESRGHGEIRE